MIDLVGGLRDLTAGSLDEHDLHTLCVAVRGELEARVGSAIVDGMTAAQLEELEAAIDGEDEDTAHALLVRYCPRHDQVVRREWALLRAEVAEFGVRVGLLPTGNGSVVRLGRAA